MLWWIDLILAVIFCVLVGAGWHESASESWEARLTHCQACRLPATSRRRTACSGVGGSTVVAILLPTTVIGVQLSVATSDRLLVGHTAAANLFLASCWLLASIIGGLYVVFVAATRGISENLHHRMDVSVRTRSNCPRS